MTAGGPGVRLALDTATDRLSVAAARGADDVCAERGLEGARRHAGALLPLIDEVLRDVAAVPAEVAVVALSDGPGSFTGLRVGATVAKAIAVGNGAALFTASTLLVRAAGAAQRGQRVLALSSALRGEAFAGVWAFGADDTIREIVPPRAVDAAGMAALPPVDLAVGEGPAALIHALEAHRRLQVVGPAWPAARTLLALLGRAGGCQPVEDPIRWEPGYGRPAEAQVRWEQAHGRTLPHSSGDPR